MNIFSYVLKENWAKQALRLLKHELRRGELTIVVLAITLGVTSVFSLAGFSDRIKQALINESTSFIAADRVLQTSRSLDLTSEKQLLTRKAIDKKSEQLEVEQAQQVLMSSMVFAENNMQLVEIQAVSDGYPLRGELLVSFDDNLTTSEVVNAPELGTVFIEEKLRALLDVSFGDTLDIGESTFVIKGVATQIPDASFSVFTSGAKVLINIKDLDATQLVKPGSRLTYKYLFAGDTDNIASLDQWLSPQVNDSQRWFDIQSKQSPLANALNKAEKYLSLASLLGIILAAVAVAVASRRYAEKHQSGVAVYKAMGASKSYIKKLYYLHWTLLSLFSIALGLFCGYILAQLGLFAIEDYLPVKVSTSASSLVVFGYSLTPIGFYPLFMAIITGILCSFAFALTPLKQLVATSPLTVIRSANLGGSGDSLTARAIYYLPPISALFALLVLFSKDIILSVALLIGGGIASAILLAFGQLLMQLSRSVGSKSGAAWHLALANLQRRAKANSVQLVSFTIAIKLLLMIIVIKTALLSEWQAQLPEHAPNTFLVNIAQDQVNEVEQFVKQQNLVASDVYAVVRGRLTAINEDKIAKQVSKEASDGSDNGRKGVGRELNLTWRAQLPDENTIEQGAWWQDNTAQVSVEQSIAKRLNVGLGDKLTFQLGSEQFTVPVTSIRKVNWQSMQPNFYMIFSPQVLSDFPASYISSLHVPLDKKKSMQRFLADYPTISVIDVDAMIVQLRKVIDQVSTAVEFILVLVVFAGCLVLIAQVQASMEEREREIAILRTIGAKGRLLRNSVLLEFVALGAIAGLMASVAMELTVYLLQHYLFNMQTSFHFEFWLLGILAGGGFVGLVGVLSCWRLLNLSSVALIRRTM
ncbi:FtsX-like permease family protein [Colwellia sp. KU-HH00111]|uniref:ABC transporter permease n=1 Tax=Colwellia sp. KU-HH00111 TaxID=3127652 RepID=UPI003107A7DE